MKLTIMAYAAKGYQEFLLPNLDNADYVISLAPALFGLSEEVRISMEVLDGAWSFCEEKQYSLQRKDGEERAEKSLQDGDIWELTAQGKRIVLMALANDSFPPLYRKYSLSGVNQIQIGKADDNHIRYDFQGYISGNHAVLFRSEGGWRIQDNSKNGTYRNGHRIKGQEPLSFGDQLTFFGLRLVFLGTCLALCTVSGEARVMEEILHPLPPVQPERSGEPEKEPEKTYFKRSPRTIEKIETEPVEIEGPPPLQDQKKRPLLLTIGPSLTMALPMLMGCMMTLTAAGSSGSGRGLSMFAGILTALTSGALGVFWALTNIRYAGKEEEEQAELRYNTYGNYLIEITESIRKKYEENRRILLNTYLSGRECCRFGEDEVRLWNHNERQQDFLWVRLGTGTVPFQVPIQIPKERFTLIRDDLAEKPALIRDTYQWLTGVPICVGIRERGCLGIVGGSGKQGAYAVCKNMIAQIAANHCYTDVKLVIIFDETKGRAENWDFARWLPHVWLEDKKTRLIAGNKRELGDICYEMSKVLQARLEQENKKGAPLPHFVIFVDDPELLDGELLERFVYYPGKEAGVSSVLLAERYEDLPNSCENIIVHDGKASKIFHIYNQEEESKDLVIETVEDEELRRFAARLHKVEVQEEIGNGEIPVSLDFMELYGAAGLSELHVEERWKKSRNYETMRVPIGQKAGGSLCYLDLHEKYHGPHGLVAGTTGSGKSETLQTYILSLALNFSPEDVAFFIIDFKGGGMANLFTGLPHLAGQISNLSGNQVQRAMISIKSENRRRQRLLAEYGVNHINAYTRMYKKHQTKEPIPHLLIIIDEFAELKREEPEFMKELISVAQVGRSLGVHLILATQKPSGTVDDNIWSNSRFRLCLRVQDRQDSNDMLHKPDAAYITEAGRGYLQVGSDEIYELFQSGYSGAGYSEESAGKPAAVVLSRTGKELLSGKNKNRKLEENGKQKTQLEVITAYLQEVASGIHCSKNPALWLPVLPEKLYLDSFPETGKASGEWLLETAVGLCDDPANQAQRPFTVSFSKGGHLAVCGMVASGKSTFLQTLLYGLIKKYTADQVQFYILDYSSRLLLSFEQAPHTGGIAVDTDEEKVQKLFSLLSQILSERKELFGGGNYSQYRQAHGQENPVPAILLVIDNIGNFREKTGGRFDDMLLRLSREGLSYGIFLVVTAAGFGASELPSRIADNMKTMISLEMSDKFKYAEVLHTSRIEILPEKDRKGRGLCRSGDRILEFQTALAFEAADAYQLGAGIEAICLEKAKSWQGRRARRIPQIPEKPTLEAFRESDAYPELSESRRWLPLGYLAADASVCGINLYQTFCYLIQGRGRSGKTNVLKLLLDGAAKKKDARVCLIDLDGSLKAYEKAKELVGDYLGSEEQVYDFFKDTIPVFRERNGKKHALMAQSLDEEEVAEEMNRLPQYFIFINDLAAFVELAYRSIEGRGSIGAYLENITQKGAHHGFYFFGCLNPEDHGRLSGYKLYKNMTAWETGIHLGGNLGGQRIFRFDGIPYAEQSKTEKPGSGWLPADENGQCKKLILPRVLGNPTEVRREA